MKKIECPYCGMRLFDTREGGQALIEIKCTRCRKIVKVELNKEMLRPAVVAAAVG